MKGMNDTARVPSGHSKLQASLMLITRILPTNSQFPSPQDTCSPTHKKVLSLNREALYSAYHEASLEEESVDHAWQQKAPQPTEVN
jgi:hypothetical protein